MHYPFLCVPQNKVPEGWIRYRNRRIFLRAAEMQSPRLARKRQLNACLCEIPFQRHYYPRNRAIDKLESKPVTELTPLRKDSLLQIRISEL